MKRRIIEPNLLLSVDKVENNKDNVGELFCRNTENEEIKVSFIKLQTKIMVVSALSGVISAALITAVFTSLADKFIK